MNADDLTFGVEIEAYAPNAHVIANAVRAAGVEINIEAYGHSTPRAWKIVTDGSLGSRNLGGGYEVVSPVLKGEAGRRQVEIVAKAMVDAGCVVDRTCGLHVHVGIAGASVAQVRNLAKLWIKYEEQFDSIVPAGRRGNANGFCKSNYYASFAGLSADTASNGSVQEIGSRLNAATTIGSIAKVMNGQSPSASMARGMARYYKLNFQSYAVYGTVEFRMHSGTLDGQKMVNWIKLVTGLVSRSFGYSTVKLSRKGTFEEMFKKVEPQVRRYYEARRAALSTAS